MTDAVCIVYTSSVRRSRVCEAFGFLRITFFDHQFSHVQVFPSWGPSVVKWLRSPLSATSVDCGTKRFIVTLT